MPTHKKHKAGEDAAGDQKPARKCRRQQGDDLMTSVNELLCSDNSDKFELACARVAQAMELYDKYVEKQEEWGNLCGDSRVVYDDTIGAAMLLQSKVLIAEKEHLKASHAAEIQELKQQLELSRKAACSALAAGEPVQAAGN